MICKYFCIGFVDFMLKGKSLLDYTNLFSPNRYVKKTTTNTQNKIIPKYFQERNISFMNRFSKGND